MIEFNNRIVQFGFGAVGKSFFEKVSKEINFDTDKYFVISRDKLEYTFFVELGGKVDALVFTAGLGENAIDFRRELLEKVECLGIKINNEVNETIAGFKSVKSGIISTEDSKVPVYVVPTNEELMIATDTYELIK